MTRPFPCSAAAAVAALLLAGPAAAETDLFQPGDSEKSCAVLAAEINTLSANESKAAKRADSGRKLLGFAATALQVAAPLLSGSKAAGGGDYAAQQALGAIQAQAMQQQAQQQMSGAYGALLGAPTPEPAASVGAQRLARLKGIYGGKAC